MMQGLLWLLVLFMAVLAVGIGIAAWYVRGRYFSASRVHDLLEGFFGSPPSSMPVVTREYSPMDLPTLHRALEALYGQDRDGSRTIGFKADAFSSPRLKDLAAANSWCTTGPVEYEQINVGEKDCLNCVSNGILLGDGNEGKAALMVSKGKIYEEKVFLDVAASTLAAASRVAERVHAAMSGANVYRHKVLSLQMSRMGCGVGGVTLHDLPVITRDQLILPAATLDAIDTNVVQFLKKLELLRQMNRPIKRGLLFHGKPGTGKTLVARHLANACVGVTVFFLTADNLGTLTATCTMARMLEPAIVVIEDVDLIAKHREDNRYAPMLHALMNEMDGVSSAAAVIFILTTNRPDVLEEALAARPGRVDQAIEFPLPDDTCRRRLFELYGTGLDLAIQDWDAIIRRSQGASPAFIQEVMRKAALEVAIASDAGSPSRTVTDAEVLTAMRAMLVGNDRLTRQILGFEEPPRPTS
ncbi:MAG: ATP-binding protein [Candidatus Riflebacteria bacterium]|nr:ATP-binding protein [Candidatus Riflebacteria bacterium]